MPGMISTKPAICSVLHAVILIGALAAVAITELSPTLAAASPAEGRSNDLIPAFSDLQGKRYTESTFSTHPATVFLFISSQCPVSNVYSPRLNAVESAYSKQGVLVIGVYSDRQESAQAVALSAKQHGLTFPIVKDDRNSIADSLHATATPTAIVIDSHSRIVYSGRIDDNPVATHVTSHDLTNALDDVLHGRPVAKSQAPGIGCLIRRVSAPAHAAPGIPTYARDIAPILRSRCEGCHRDGEVAPFSLQTYEQASAWAPDLKRYTQNHQMPPWKPTPGYDEFKDADKRVLTDSELATIAKWADSGAPLGNPKDTPPPAKFVKGWRLGEPDMVIQPSAAYRLSADGDDVYRNFVVKTNFSEDRYVSGVEVRPGNSAVVHHMIAYIDGTPVNGEYASERLDGKDHDGQIGYTSFGGPGFNPTGMLGGWAPGNDPYLLPDGVAQIVPRGARIVIQVHYHKDGKPESDLTRLGIHFCKTTVDKLVAGGLAINFGFKIPPGAEQYEVKSMWLTGASSSEGIDMSHEELTSDQHILAVTPHMHLLGKEMKVWATLPDGTEKPLVWIKDWDFNWQMSYFLKEPLAAPKGTKIHMVAYYDNSAKNLRNPNRLKPKPVGWGESTFDEMCIAFVTTTRDDQHLNINPKVASK
jgi:peroxiredoxin